MSLPFRRHKSELKNATEVLQKKHIQKKFLQKPFNYNAMKVFSVHKHLCRLGPQEWFDYCVSNIPPHQLSYS